MASAIWRGLRTHAVALAILVGLGAGVVILAMGGVYVASQSPSFCTTCHYMEPYYAQWKTSKHADVSCVTCHPVRPVTNTISAIRYFTGTQDARPRAEVLDGICLQSGCHETRLLEGESTFKGKIRFDHSVHITGLRRGKQLRCTSCHSQIVQGEHIAVTEGTCFLCHFKGVGEAQAIGGCTTCHGTPSETVRREGFVFSHDSYLKVGVGCQQCHLQVVEGNGDVPRDRCLSCHVGRLDRYEDSQFIHRTHVTEHEVDCQQCHEPVRHGQVRMIRALEAGCENCHKGLHSPQKDMYIGTGGAGTADTPSRMFAAQVSCEGCHTRAVHVGTPEFAEASLEAERKSCVTCHGKGYDQMLDDWVRETDHLTRALEPELGKAEAVLRASEEKGDDLTQARVSVQRARHNYDFLRFGHGVHNVEYAVKLAKATVGYLDDAMGRMEPGYKPTARPRMLTTPDGYCTVLCHTRLGLPEETKFDHLDFPHALHADDLEVACTRCHSPDKHKMRVITRTECMACHHEAQDIACGHCHREEEALYAGKLQPWGVVGEPDVMSEGEVECEGCHDLSAAISIQAVQEMCVECHEAGYDEILTEWINEVQDGLGRASLLAEQVRQSIDGSPRGTRGRPDAQALLASSKSLIDLVEKGKGAHNHAISVDLLQRAEEGLRKALAEAGDELPPR